MLPRFDARVTKVFTWSVGRFLRGFAHMTSTPYTLTIRQGVVRKGEYHPKLPRAGHIALLSYAGETYLNEREALLLPMW